MTTLICGRCGAKFHSETESDSDEFCNDCIREFIEMDLEEKRREAKD